MVDHKRSSVEYRVMTENTVVIKLSGKALDGQKELGELFAAAHSSRVVIVHGGGVEVDSLFKDLNLKVEKKNGLRVSPKEHMPFISAALCGMCNKKLQALAVKNGLKAIGMIASDGNSLGVEQLSADLGMVGKVSPVSADYINMLLDGGYTPVIASVAFDSEGQMYNVNADDVASAIGLLLSAPVYFISDVPGVLDKEHGILHEAWAPFAEGNDQVFTQPVLQQIAAKHGRTTGQVMLRWLLQRGIAVIPKTVHKERMAENFDVFGFTLDEEDMEQIRGLDRKKSTIYDEMDPQSAVYIGSLKIHD